MFFCAFTLNFLMKINGFVLFDFRTLEIERCFFLFRRLFFWRVFTQPNIRREFVSVQLNVSFGRFQVLRAHWNASGEGKHTGRQTEKHTNWIWTCENEFIANWNCIKYKQN